MPKRFITLFLAVILTCFLAVSIFAAEDDPLTMAVEVSSSTAISGTPDVCIKAGDEVQVKVTVTSTPSIATYELTVNYNADAFELKSNTLGDAAKVEPIVALSNGNVRIVCMEDGDLLKNGTLITLTFVAKDYHGEASGTEDFTLTGVEAYKSDWNTADVNVTNAKVELHKFDAGVKFDGTCQANATTTYSCSECDKKVVIDSGVLGAHKFDAKTVDAKYLKADATCTTQAEYFVSCSLCGEKGTETFKNGVVAGHKYAEKVDAKYLKSEATCTEAAVYFKSCSVCEEKGTDTFKNGAVAGHKYADKVEDKYLKSAATCTEAAVYFKSCSVCGEKGTDTFKNGAALGHKFDAEKVEEKYLKSVATCNAKAVYYKSCTVCGVAGTATFESGEFAAHAAADLVVLEAKEPTCTETGLTAGEMCSKCGVTTIEQTTVNAKGHVAGEWVIDVEPKIGKEGKQSQACTVCEAIVNEAVIEAKSPLPIILIVIAVVLVGGGVAVFFVLKNKKNND